jgi:ubiquinone/menaquinone biosynthesis C-methylase UbiE
MSDRLTRFLKELHKDVYPEPRSAGHDSLTAIMAREVVKYLEKGALILDVGCGQGPALEWFRQEGFPAVGTTLSVEDAVLLDGKGFNFVRADMHDLPFRDGKFACVWARHVLEHSPIPLLALAEFWRVLPAGGVLYVETPAPATSCRHETNANHYSVFGFEAWRCLLIKAGFEPIEGREIQLQTGAGPDVYLSFICKKKP